MDALRLGDPAKLENDIGPIIDKNAAQNLNAHAQKMQKTARFMHKTTLPKGCEAGTFVAPHLIEIDNMEQLGKEQFGPMLHVIRYKASELDAILNSAFSGGYGLTFGVHTRMDHRWMKLFALAPVGNSYVNRNMVGAVVGSQPFGGQGLSGTGFKAGGPRYLYKFAVEKVLTVNIMASGGNADLLTLNAD
jgi:RHH-type proline utilization regulon transcriptional repressor/proline dehydrogenase/delta 1-pyrroline-5-carboxylate dehydrogenase